MKKTFFIIQLGILFILTLFISCSSTRSASFGADTDIDPYTKIKSYNEYDLIVSDQGVEYTIDISTAEGRLQLNKLKLEDAKQLVNSEAARKYNCAMLVRPKYTYLKKGKHILRITVFGFPAKYKNSLKDENYVPIQNRHKTEIDLNVNN